MKRIASLFIIILLISQSVFASENYIKVTYYPGYRNHKIEARKMDVVLGGAFNKDDQLIAKVYEKLKKIEATSRLDYVVPDAPFITLEIKYNDETIKSSNSIGISKPKKFLEYETLWEEAYSLVWKTLESRLEPPNVK